MLSQPSNLTDFPQTGASLSTDKYLDHLTFIYGAEKGREICQRLNQLVEDFRPKLSGLSSKPLTHEDAILITYGDMVQDGDINRPHLETLNRFLSQQISDIISTVHILPFYPWSSDDGFSVIDYLAIDEPLGDWTDVKTMRKSFRLMFDAVINHISQESDWFQRFLRGEKPYTNYFKTVDPSVDLSAVFRPRALPLLTPFNTANGTHHVWTTFSADQIDLNFESADLLLDVITVLLKYIEYGAELIRLDAIGFMWKVPGTRSLHLPETHAIIQLMRAVLDEVAPQVMLVTETNVPHVENISYFGDGFNEAQMVYNFSLPPLLMHAFHTGNADYLVRWAASLELPSDKTTFFNFCASHDGVGVTPARGILPDNEIEQMAARVEALGGRVSYKTNSDGSQSAYELNINYLNALGQPDVIETAELKSKRFLASQAVMLALRGVPGIYFHSLFGSENWQEGVEQTGHNRTINRQKLNVDELQAELTSGLRHQVFDGYSELLRARKNCKAFHPNGKQIIHELHPAVVAIERRHAGESVFCVHNVSDTSVDVPMPMTGLFRDLISGRPLKAIVLEPYQYRWLKVLS
ncbi:MAG: alpha-amylase family glycosyl hydrolase [Anaerolineae bacterium]